jgi:hypothetical protein
MARKNKSKMNLLSGVENLDADEIEEDGFSEGDVNFGTPIAVFNFGDAAQSESGSKSALKESAPNKTAGPAICNVQTNKPAQRGITPPIDGEEFILKRSYQMRPSTVRKLSELRAKHPDVTVYLNSILDAAISHYYTHIMQEEKKLRG